VEKSRKRSREESESELEGPAESSLLDKGITWRTKEGQVCEECRKGGRKYHWLDAKRAKSCHYCSGHKTGCVKPWEVQSEAGSSKKRKVGVDKGKGKVREVEAKPEFGLREVVEELRGLREDLREFQKEFRHAARVGDQVASRLKKVN
jgi:hypothetical protein